MTNKITLKVTKRVSVNITGNIEKNEVEAGVNFGVNCSAEDVRRLVALFKSDAPMEVIFTSSQMALLDREE